MWALKKWCVTKVAHCIISKIKAPLGNTVKHFFLCLKNHLLHKDNFLAHLSCHVTYFTSFSKCSDPNVKLADLRLFVILTTQSQKCNISTSGKVLHIYFDKSVDIIIDSLKWE